MAGQHLRLARDGQLCQLAQAFGHLGTAAALEVGAANAAREQGVAAEQIFPAQQHHAAGRVAGRVPDREGQLIHRDALPFRIAAVGSGKRIHPVTCQIGLFAVELRVPLGLQGFGTAHVVVVAVGAQDGGEGHMVLL